jgi:SOS response regulatory protein OraA/RecX
VENFVAYHAARGQGPMRVRADLRKAKGLQGDLIEECLGAYPDWMLQLRKSAAKEVWRGAAERITLTSSARRDSWVTEVSRARRYERP